MTVLTRGPMGRGLGRAVLGGFYAYFLAHWLTSLLMFRQKLGFGFEGVVRYYRGDPERFLNPRSFTGLLEVTHFHLFAFGMFFVVFGHLAVFSGLPRRLQGLLVGALGLFLTGDLAAGWLVRYVAPGFAWLKLACFWGLQAASLALVGALLWRWCRPGGPGQRASAAGRPIPPRSYDFSTSRILR
ncbi:hypothetical protein [Deferrisoma camini]|uniref:hypothetical protein n=1 Tax=Deferrisoma camini TaxID=1035120 RepID=UPI00046D18C5|nr:hypothetical protein [Deferrisoma camini]